MVVRKVPAGPDEEISRVKLSSVPIPDRIRPRKLSCSTDSMLMSNVREVRNGLKRTT